MRRRPDAGRNFPGLFGQRHAQKAGFHVGGVSGTGSGGRPHRVSKTLEYVGHAGDGQYALTDGKRSEDERDGRVETARDQEQKHDAEAAEQQHAASDAFLLARWRAFVPADQQQPRYEQREKNNWRQDR